VNPRAETHFIEGDEIMKRQRGAGPVGLDAFAEISKRLGDLAEHLKGAIDSEPTGEGEERSSQRTFTISTPKGPLTGVAGYSVRFGSSTVEEAIKARTGAAGAGSERPGPKRPDVETVREPLVDVHDEGERIVVTAELPGVQIEDVGVEIKGRVLVIETHSARRFRSVVNLPADVAATTLATSLRNGILQASVQKATGKTEP
jgi:HSP20 family protein